METGSITYQTNQRKLPKSRGIDRTKKPSLNNVCLFGLGNWYRLRIMLFSSLRLDLWRLLVCLSLKVFRLVHDYDGPEKIIMADFRDKNY